MTATFAHVEACMHLSGERVIAAPIETVWGGLRNIAALRSSIQGCEELSGSSDAELTALISRPNGSHSTRVAGEAKVTEIQPPHSCRIAGRLTHAGHALASISLDLRLMTVPDGTRLIYEAELAFGEMIAEADARTAESLAGIEIDQFFSSFAVAIARLPVFYSPPAGRADANLVKWAQLLLKPARPADPHRP
ncbi:MULTISPECIES: SRPBCC domain-containing protein [unclassified Mesorhizobium]|uniref:CoxG family protein n=1 Tax=unclassified Mesorhizobium TaxID=325217 RepID=UPI001674C91E|nr:MULTISPECIES: SRPBCC domain-containing protein [unclassified Mesorhizobium]